MKPILPIFPLLVLCACQPMSGGLVPGKTPLPQVIERMGEPSMVWSDADGSLQLEFARIPTENGNFMARIGPDRILLSVDQVLTRENAARLALGMSRDQVRRLLGRPARTEVLVLNANEVWHWPLDDVRPARWQLDVRFASDGTVLEISRSRIGWHWTQYAASAP